MKTLPCNVTRLASAVYAGLGTPMGDKLAKALATGDWLTIASAKINPVDYVDAHTFGKDALAVSLLKKYPHLPVRGHSRVQAAVDTWWAAEKQCYDTNERLNRYLPEFAFSADLDEGVAGFLADVRKEVLHLLGPCPPILLEGRFGPGATLTDRGGDVTILHKMSNTQPALTSEAMWFLPQWLGTLWGKYSAQQGYELSFVKGNRFTTVPKTALTDRAIAIEPSINIFYQLGVGAAMRRRLAARGWNLDVAADVHRQLACDASKTQQYCTLDLSSASDTVAKVLVKLLLPPRWFAICDDLRSKFTWVQGRWVHLEKFSSMGNGYTFELETVIFAAIACAVSKRRGHDGVLGRDVFVFGDDIIAPNDVFQDLSAALAGLGFSVNKDKSFASTPFRESCGGDFYNGWPVRGFYLKSTLDQPQTLIAAFNGLRRALKVVFPASMPSTILDALLELRRQTPSYVQQCRGPEELGDIVFHDKPDRWSIRIKHGVRYVRCYRPARFAKAKLEGFDPDVQLAALTYTLQCSGGIPLRDGVRGYKVAWVPFS